MLTDNYPDMLNSTPSLSSIKIDKISKNGVKYVSLGGGSGYAVAAKRYMQALSNAGTQISWTPMVVTDQGRLGYRPGTDGLTEDLELNEFCNIQIQYDTVIVHMVPEYYPMWQKLERGKRIIGCTVWETDLIPKHWLRLLNSVDSLMVPCEWNVEVFRNCGVTIPIAVIPHIALKPQAKPAVTLADIKANDFVFYNINTWTVRKAIWLTIEAYLQAFKATDPVCLVIKTSKEDITVPPRRWRKILQGQARPPSRESIARILAKYSNPARVMVIDEDLSDQEIAMLHQRGDCYVSLCRSEGWGIGAFDACAYGNPVVITGHGGQTDFLPADQAFLIDYKLISVRDRSSWASYSKKAHWADPDIDQAAKTLRHVFENQGDARSRGKQLQSYVCEKFAEGKIGEQMVTLLGRANFS